jgi:hypothetical protein
LQTLGILICTQRARLQTRCTVLQTPASGSADLACGSANPLAWVYTQAHGSGPSTEGMAAPAPGVCSLGHNPTPLQPLELSMARHDNPVTNGFKPREASLQTRGMLVCIPRRTVLQTPASGPANQRASLQTPSARV